MAVYADWLLEMHADTKRLHSWYEVSYPVRTLLLAARLLDRPQYIDAALQYTDLFVSEQLPNGAFTASFRRKPTTGMGRREFHDILRNGKVNVADNGSNLLMLIQAAMCVTDERKQTYLDAAQRWFDHWLPIWALPNGGYGNGIWEGHKINTPYTCAMATVAAALSAFTMATGDTDYVDNAERCIEYQCNQWLDKEGRPIFLDCYPRPRQCILNDYSHTFYLLEGMCWTHCASTNAEVRALIEKRMKEWIFGENGLLAEWRASWFDFQFIAYPPEAEGELPMSRLWLQPGWELAKSNGIPHCFQYYLNHIEDAPALREKTELGLKYLSHPLKARASGVACEVEETYGKYAGQATGFAGLSLAEAVAKDAVFDLAPRSTDD